MSELKWTSEAPKEEGLYWMRLEGKACPIVSIVRIRRWFDGPMDSPREFLVFETLGVEGNADVADYQAQWAGPLEPPR